MALGVAVFGDLLALHLHFDVDAVDIEVDVKVNVDGYTDTNRGIDVEIGG